MKVRVEIEYCVGCRWLLRAAWTAQELLTSFESDLQAVSLKPSDQPGTFRVFVDAACIWDRKARARFSRNEGAEAVAAGSSGSESRFGAQRS